MFVWVRIWWFHNLASQTMGPKLRARTIENIRQLPEPWLAPFLADYKARLTEELRQLLDTLLEDDAQAEALPYRMNTVSMPHPTFPCITVTPTIKPTLS